MQTVSQHAGACPPAALFAVRAGTNGCRFGFTRTLGRRSPRRATSAATALREPLDRGKTLPDKDSTKAPGTESPSSTAGRSTPDTGAALRSVYQRMVEEQIPDDLLALLGKLD